METLGQMVIYGGSANRISTALQVDIKLAEQLLANYFNLFPELKIYIENSSALARYQKWIQCPITNRRYFVSENNAKGLSDDNTSARKAANTLIQGSSSVMTKLAGFYVDKLFDDLNTKYKQSNKPARIIGLVHDCNKYCRG